MVDLSVVTAWIFSVMTSLFPPAMLAQQEVFIPEANESVAQVEERYRGWSEAIAKEVYENENILYKGAEGKKKTVALVLAIMKYESGFRRDVDLGIGRERLAKIGWNDHGRSWCMMQINLGKKPYLRNGTWVEDSAVNTEEGFSGRDLLADRGKCVKAGINILRKSMSTCRHLPAKDWLRAYASGTCDNGGYQSESRMRLSWRILEKYSPNPRWKDKEYTSNNQLTAALE